MHTQAHPTAAVIGSGFGGLAAAIRLQARGYQTTIFETRDQPGGRAYVYRDNGFTYDAGPTIITAPFLIDELFELAGKKASDYIRLAPCDPFYRIAFHDGTHFDYNGDPAHMREEVRRIAPGDVAGYETLVEKTHEIFKRAFLDLADQPFTHFTDMIRVAPDLIRLRSHESVFAMAKRYVKNEKLRQILSFHPLLVGGHPFASSSIYGMIMYLERKWGVHFVMGGTGALVRAFVRLFEEMGGTLRLNTRVEEIEIENGNVQGLRLAGGERFGAPVVVSNGDVANTYRKLVAPRFRRKWTDAKLARMRYSMGLFVMYFGTNRTYPDLAHHTIYLTERYKPLLDDIFNRKVLAKDFSLYLHAPTRTDTSMAPPGHECFYVLSPVPHLDADIDWEKEKERYGDAILAVLEEKLIPDLRKHLVSKLIMTPKDFETELDAYKGSGFQFEPVLWQSAWFRPHNKSEDVEGLYFSGAGTHPGAGVPGVLSSAKVLDRVVPDPVTLAVT
jgi:phytoene desaturase